MTAKLIKQRIPNGQSVVYAERWRYGKGKVGYLRPSLYITSPAWVWSVITTPPGREGKYHTDHFRQGAHAAAWLLEITPKGEHLDEDTWRAIEKAAPDMLPAFRKRTGQDWKPDVEQAKLF